MEGLAKVLKVFVEKRLVPTVIGIVAALITLALVPEDASILTKLGKPLFVVLVWGIAFLVVLATIELWKKAVSYKQKKEAEYDNQQYVDRKNKEILENYWSFIDKLSPEDRRSLRELVESGNRAVEKSALVICDDVGLWNSRLVRCTEVEKPVMEQQLGNTNYYASFGVPVGGKKLYKLKDDVYEALRYGLERYGKISHFE